MVSCLDLKGTAAILQSCLLAGRRARAAYTHVVCCKLLAFCMLSMCEIGRMEQVFDMHVPDTHARDMYMYPYKLCIVIHMYVRVYYPNVRLVIYSILEHLDRHIF